MKKKQEVSENGKRVWRSEEGHNPRAEENENALPTLGNLTVG